MKKTSLIPYMLSIACASGPLYVAAQSLPPTPLPTLPAAAPATPAQPVLPSTALPPTTPTPATGSAVSQLPTQPAQAETIKLSSDPTFEKAVAQSSMGNSGLGIFFTPHQMQAMKTALIDFESRPVSNSPQANLEVDLLKPKEAPKIVEPPVYPVFYLSSIAYHGPKDWSIWVSGHKITSSHNNTDLAVLSVSETQASFIWKPTFKEALTTRKTANAFAPLDKVKNKLTKTPQFSYDADFGVVSFTLKTNQSFNAAYMNSFEGFIESPTLPVVTPEPTTQADNSAQTIAASPKP
jgi:hypothetical protein